MIVRFLEILTEYISIVLCLNKVVNKRINIYWYLKIVTLNAKGSESLPTHYFFTTKRATLAHRPFCKVCIYR